MQSALSDLPLTDGGYSAFGLHGFPGGASSCDRHVEVIVGASIDVCIHVNIHRYICKNLFVCIYMCIYRYIYIDTHTCIRK